MRKCSSLAVFLCAFALAGSAQANPMDLTLSRLYRDNASCDAALHGDPDPITGRVMPDNVACADQVAFRELSKEFGLVIAPALLAPAETLGYAGFYLGLEGWLTVLNAGDSPGNVWVRGTEDQNPDDVLFVSALHVRKGLPWSFELGTSVSYVASTEQVLLGADIRWALLEGYREGWQGYFPDIAVRGAVNRLMGDDELDMTVWSIDTSISHPFAISGVATITPFFGYQFIQVIADNSLVLNGGPASAVNPVDPYRTSGPTLIECTTEDPTSPQRECVGGVNGPPDVAYLDFSREYIDRHRIFMGVRFIWEHLSFATQVGVDPDSSFNQTEFGVTLGLDY